MSWVKRLLNPDLAREQMLAAVDQLKLDNALRRARGCYSCGGDITRAVALQHERMGEPAKYYSCESHYAALLAAAGTGR